MTYEPIDYEKLGRFIVLFKEDLKFEKQLYANLQRLLIKLSKQEGTVSTDLQQVIALFNELLKEEMICCKKALKKCYDYEKTMEETGCTK